MPLKPGTYQKGGGQVDYFLKLEGVPSESSDGKHKGEMDIESFSWKQTQSGTAGYGAGAGAGKVVKNDFEFVKRVDKGSPLLMIGCATGQHFKTATLTARKAGQGQQDYLKITMTECLISSYQTDGFADDENHPIPTETFTLNFAKLEMSYKEQKQDGSLGGEVKQAYDFQANQKV